MTMTRSKGRVILCIQMRGGVGQGTDRPTPDGLPVCLCIPIPGPEGVPGRLPQRPEALKVCLCTRIFVCEKLTQLREGAQMGVVLTVMQLDLIIALMRDDDIDEVRSAVAARVNDRVLVVALDCCEDHALALRLKHLTFEGDRVHVGSLSFGSLCCVADTHTIA
jgi:hypothetical protein